MTYQAFDPERAVRLHRRKVLTLSLLGLVAALLLQAVLMRSWIRTDTRPPSWDQCIHLEIARDYQKAIAAKNWDVLLHPVPKPGMPAFPPLYHLALQPAMSRLNPADAALWVNYGYFVLLVVCLMGLAFEFMPTYVAAAASLCFAFAPAVQGLLLTQLVDLPVVACSVAAFWAFIRTEDFTEWLPSIGFGILFAFGMLHKWSFFAYMIPAYWVWMSAVLKPQSAGPAAVAFLVAAGLTAPWYVMNWPLLLPRLIQASADFAVPVWKGQASLEYLWQSLAGLGPLLFLLGWIGLFIARYPRKEFQAWLIMLWVLSAYVFWAIVPNRQLRFLLPGLPGLAVALCGAWPPPVVWGLAGAQAVFMLNFYGGWAGPIYIPAKLTSVVLLPNDPPKAENWPIDEIVAEAEKRADPTEPVANLTLVANHHLFNGPNFTWRRQELELPRLRIRGVNRRLSEFSQFVVLKTKDLGTPGVIGGLPEASKLIKDERAWFSRAYDVARRWPLPDGSEAVLYQRAKPKAPPFGKKGTTKFQFFSQGNLEAEDLRIDLGAWDAARGVYPKARLTAGAVNIRGLQVSNVVAEFEDLLLIPAEPDVDPWSDVRFLKLKTLRLRSARVTADALKAFILKRAKGLKLDSVAIEGGAVSARGAFKGVPLAAALALELQKDPRRLDIRLREVKLGPNPIPVDALNRIKELTVPLTPNPETPFSIELPGLSLKGGALSVP